MTIQINSVDKATEKFSSHVMMYDFEHGRYVHVWGAETDSPVVKQNVKGTTRQKKIQNKKTFNYYVDVARKSL